MDIIETALKIALEAHSGKKDKAGETYILHPLRVMERMETKQLKAVAILHDVIEDSSFTANDLKAEGLPEEIVEGVVHLTRKDGESYFDFIARASQNALAREVKIADLVDNINILRFKKIGQKDIERIQKYHKAHGILSGSTQHLM